MKIVARYSFNNGSEVIGRKYPQLLAEIEEVLSVIDAHSLPKKKSKEKTMRNRKLFSPPGMNKQFKREFGARQWRTIRVPCDYPTNHYVDFYSPPPLRKGAFREMDFLKDRLGVEVQLGKYAFMVYNVCAKMTIFKNLGYINAGVEIVPVKELADEMSTGVSYFEQFAWDLDKRGVSDIDIPVLILGITA